MLAAMIPVGLAVQSTGLSGLIASNISDLAPNLNQAWILIIILVITMAVSDIINNAATAVIMAPISYEIAINFGYDVNAFLMVVAIGASCAFLTPIGHQCNTVVMRPGNYKFKDYWRMGLPLRDIDYCNSDTDDSFCLGLMEDSFKRINKKLANHLNQVLRMILEEFF